MAKLEDEIKQGKPFNNTYHKATVNLIFTGKWMIQKHSEILKKHNLSVQQYNILRILKGIHPQPASVNYIRERMLDKMSDASRIVETMNKKGLVIRSPNIQDRRKVEIIITNKGLQTIAKVDDTAFEDLLNNLNILESEQLNLLLDKMRK